jgi:hypothetical protein
VAELLQCVGWLDPVGGYSDRSAAHKELQRFLSPREDLVGTAVRGLQSPVCCVLAEKDVCAVTEVLVHECAWRGVACCWNWCEAGHVSAKLCDEVHCWSGWHMMAAFSVRWKRSTSLLTAELWAVVLES